MNKFRPEANFVQGLSGDFIGKNNIFRMIREFARYSNINNGYYMVLTHFLAIPNRRRQIRFIRNMLLIFFKGIMQLSAMNSVKKILPPPLFSIVITFISLKGYFQTHCNPLINRNSKTRIFLFVFLLIVIFIHQLRRYLIF